MIAVLALHVIAAIVAGTAGTWLGSRRFLVAAVAPASTVVWVAMRGAEILDHHAYTQQLRWMPGLGLSFSLRVDALALVMLGLVGGIGVLVFVYASQYFNGDEAGLGRFTAFLTCFAGAMTGLVVADDLLLLFVFWELTSVTSYGLIGFKDGDPKARASAQQALLITGAGGLVLLAGLLLVRTTSGVGSLHELTEAGLSGTAASWAAVLILIGCFTKSAQVPFHGWLPGAMAAPTPVSSYLHSATMVKAGVFLVARLSPAFADVALWRGLAVTVGIITMLWGGYRSLRMTDIKLILAYGTVSQLGMLVATFGGGTAKLYLAGMAMLVAHALFKACLFMSVGIIDHATHTREVHELSGLRTRMPVLFVVCAIAGASMAGVIPFFGFVAKETIIGGFLKAEFTLAWLALAGIVVGSGFTAAYTLRFMWGAFGTKPGVETPFHAPGRMLVSPTLVLAVPTVVLGLVPAVAEKFVGPAAGDLDHHALDYHLHLWPGFVLGLGLSVVALTIGAVLWFLRSPIEAAQARIARRQDAAALFHRLVGSCLSGAQRITGLIQMGSQPVYLAVITLGIVGIPTIAILTDAAFPESAVLHDSPVQSLVVVAMIAASIGIITAKRRFAAVLQLGVVGFGSTALFVILGAPDLALTQALVETLSIALYVLVLRHLPQYFEPQQWGPGRFMRVGIAALVGVAMFVLTVTSVASRTAVPVDEPIAALSYPEGNGKNIVNVTLVDIRGFDTVGEATVLAVAALGVVSLVRGGRRRFDPDDGTAPGEVIPGGTNTPLAPSPALPIRAATTSTVPATADEEVSRA